MKIMDLKDRFARILAAGIIASITLLGLNLFSHYVLKLSERRFINYSSLMIFGRKSGSFAEDLLSSIAQIGFAAGIFIIFSHLFLKKEKQNFLLRGLFIGFGSWFIIMSLAYIIGIHKILTISLGSAVSFMVTSSIWGITGAWVLRALDEKYVNNREPQLEVKKQRISRLPEPSYKLKPKK
ncbi:hypothetical protein SAMN05660649_04863 [Desulfotomaculum arcticum]|uniref:Uncharacterized protein n=1 Tax=Desulfotruncus arcticus DSM 17038 TaxID=1121424 RepID=A0A1I2ZDP6_9FIRM|nr:hypothetical protein [Desulfotruncus arcticus]SFH35221.1 hypothetical protein SAMN05660649_04863 [Desulfotomaculum arcticum] [Desulfotruncus arcticus DSM 17038]